MTGHRNAQVEIAKLLSAWNATTPVHLTHLSRRRFLQSAGSSILLCGHSVSGAESDVIDADLVYLLNDPHIGEKQPAASPVPTHLQQVVSQLVQRPTKPACVVINGDLALHDGQPGDYRHLAKLLQSLQMAAIETHLTLGNHDNRDTFYEVMKEQRPDNPPIASRHLAIVETRHAISFCSTHYKRRWLPREPLVTNNSIGSHPPSTVCLPSQQSL